MPSPSVIYVDLKNGKAASTAGGSTMSWPAFTAGGSLTYATRFLESDAALGFVEKDQRVAAMRVAMGYKTKSPISGRFKIKVGNKSSALLDFSCTQRNIEAALNAIDGVSADPFIAEEDGKSFLLRRASGASVSLSSTDNTLSPFTFISFDGVLISGSWVYRMVFRVAPLAFTDLPYQSLPDAPQVSIIQQGGMDPSGTVIWNTIQKIFIPPTFRGTFQFRRLFGRTALMDITDGASTIESNLNAMLAPEKGLVTVTNPTSFVLHVEFTGSLAGTDVPPLLVNVYSAPPGDWSFNLNLDTPEMRSALAETSPLTLQFEAEADFYTQAPSQQNPYPPTIRMKLWSDSVQVHRPLIFSEFATSGTIDWLRPPSGRDYIPFTRDQVITGQQNYSSVIGDGAATIFAIPHHLNSEDLAAVSVRENVSGGKIIPQTEYAVTVLDANSVELEFLTSPDSDSLVVTILAAGPASAFQTHTHTIQQVVNLADQLDYLGSAVAYLQSLVPAQVLAPPATSVSPNAVNSVASFGEILPDASLEDSPLSISSQVMTSQGTAVAAVPGTDLQEQLATNAAALVALQAQLDAAKKAVADATAAGATIEEAKAIAAQGATAATKTIITVMETLALGTAALPVIWPPLRKNLPPTLLRALAGNAVAHSPVTLPNITPASVYRSTGGITLPSSSGRKAALIPAQGYFASDGASFYPVYLGGDALWHPSDMDREIARIAISSKAFPSGSKLDFSWSTTAVLLPPVFDSSKTDLFARYSMQVLAIPASPSLVSAPVVIAGTDLSFSQSKETRSFSLTVTRPDGDAESETSLTSYGVRQIGAPFPSGDVVLVIALKEFETDSNPPSTGQLSLHVPPSQLTISK